MFVMQKAISISINQKNQCLQEHTIVCDGQIFPAMNLQRMQASIGNNFEQSLQMTQRHKALGSRQIAKWKQSLEDKQLVEFRELMPEAGAQPILKPFPFKIIIRFCGATKEHITTFTHPLLTSTKDKKTWPNGFWFVEFLLLEIEMHALQIYTERRTGNHKMYENGASRKLIFTELTISFQWNYNKILFDSNYVKWENLRFYFYKRMSVVCRFCFLIRYLKIQNLRKVIAHRFIAFLDLLSNFHCDVCSREDACTTWAFSVQLLTWWSRSAPNSSWHESWSPWWTPNPIAALLRISFRDALSALAANRRFFPGKFSAVPEKKWNNLVCPSI